MTDEMKPCPFCENKIILTRTGEGHTCNRCGSVGYWDWNTRPIEDRLTLALSAAEAERDAASANLAAANTEIVDLYNALHDIVAETLAHDNTPYIALAKIVRLASDALGVDPVWGGAAKDE